MWSYATMPLVTLVDRCYWHTNGTPPIAAKHDTLANRHEGS